MKDKKEKSSQENVLHQGCEGQNLGNKKRKVPLASFSGTSKTKNSNN